MAYKILIINPGSTSTKIGVFEDETLLFEETLIQKRLHSMLLFMIRRISERKLSLTCLQRRILISRHLMYV